VAQVHAVNSDKAIKQAIACHGFRGSEVPWKIKLTGWPTCRGQGLNPQGQGSKFVLEDTSRPRTTTLIKSDVVLSWLEIVSDYALLTSSEVGLQQDARLPQTDCACALCQLKSSVKLLCCTTLCLLKSTVSPKRPPFIFWLSLTVKNNRF